jgi:hypothetical protein
LPYKRKTAQGEGWASVADGPGQKGVVAAPFFSDLALLLLFDTGFQEKQRKKRWKRFRNISKQVLNILRTEFQMNAICKVCKQHFKVVQIT